jgi:hypothetical protein
VKGGKEEGRGGKEEEEEEEDDDRGVRTRRPQRALPQLPMFVSFFLSEGGPPLQQNEERPTHQKLEPASGDDSA